MPRNITGTYSLPIAAFVPGGVIKASDHNANYSDIATALTQSFATTGVSTMTGPIKAASGTVGAPSITFGGSPTTGFYLQSANQVSWTAAGVNAANFNANGTVEFGGNGTFDSNLSVLGNVTVNGSLTVGGIPIYFFPAGTRTTFIQASAPTGWTQVATYNDYAVRIISGAGGGITSGTKAFSAVFNAAITNLASHNHGVADPGHTHSIAVGATGGPYGLTNAGAYVGNEISNAFSGLVTNGNTTGVVIGYSGSGATTAFDVQFINMILCQKN
jgi:hypothetical protein